jgi:hypothetical protein
MRRAILMVLGAGVVCAIGAVSAASGAGPGPGLSQGWDGVTRGNECYVSVPVRGSTSIQAIDRNGGRVVRFMTLKGTWGIPLVAYDGTTEGLLPNGRTLLLAQQIYNGRGLRKSTSFAFVDLRRMKLLRKIKLGGAFSVDALSPNGRYLYLIEYVSEADLTAYRVRAYDLDADRLLAKIVADKRSWETTMQGSPVSRLRQGDWAYTLYGGPARPFIHALDTRHVAAVCIDLPWKTSPGSFMQYRLRSDGDGHLVVRGPRGRALAVVDRQSFRVLSYVRSP